MPSHPDRRHLLRLTVGTAVAGAALAGSARAAAAPAPAAAAPGHPRARYSTADYPVSMNLFCFNQNIQSWIKNRANGAPKLSTMAAVDWAAEAGFDAVDITAYYIPGYETHTMPSRPAEEITAFATGLRERCERLGLPVTGTGVFNDFADPSRRELDVERTRFWIDVARAMGAPAIRVFSGVVPADLDAAGGWEAVTRARIVPALREIAEYAAPRGVRILLQNHGDMTATAEQTIRTIEWTGHENVSLINDTGYFRPFRAPTGDGYDWYRDIAACLPYSASIQVKRLPAGADSAGPPMDYERLFTALRLSGWEHAVPVERLWAKDAPDNPGKQPTPPFDQVAALLADVRAGLAATRQSPFRVLRERLRDLHRERAVGLRSWLRLSGLLKAAELDYRRGSPAGARQALDQALALLAAAPDVAPAARESLLREVGALRTVWGDVYG
ncbi:sugar phosphate isomerase/epimerase family protein [Streptomyces sp. NPDC004134]|uniref:sugar phosphate isomerase/epimerase family protein n=1 Tax=Streptomyces sp. NPDC004134 TaxID=3364691 RepID=UPI00369FB9C5